MTGLDKHEIPYFASFTYKTKLMKNIYSAIVFFEPELNIPPRKYRNITNLDSFADFCRNSGAKYINVYEKRTKLFYCRIWLKNDI